MGRKQGVFVHSEKIECKTCKKWFVSEEKKKEHLALHQSCPYPGCTFSAIEKGFKQATKSWGEDLPDICQKTLEETKKNMNDWKNGVTTAADYSDYLS